MFNKSYRSLYLREQDEIDKREELIQSNEPLITSWIRGIVSVESWVKVGTNARGTRGGRTIEIVSTPYKNFLDFIPSRRGSSRQS